MAAAAPAQLQTRLDDTGYELAGSDVDAEGEDDPEIDFDMGDLPGGEPADGDAVSDADAEGEEVDEDSDDAENDGDLVGAVKQPNGLAGHDSDEEAIADDDSSVEASSVAEEEDDSDKSSSDDESVAAEEWEGGSEVVEDAEVEVATRNNCIFCNQDEEHDPSEDFEEYMACAVCGDNSHRQCAREATSLKSDEDAEQWRCPECVENALEPDNGDDDAETVSRRRSSAPKFTRDLLPAQRGTSRPDSHSVFNNLILLDDPLDGSRSLRKRKASSDEVEEPISVPKKRRKKQVDSESGSEAPISPLLAGDDEEDDDDQVDDPPVKDAGLTEERQQASGSPSTQKSRSSRAARQRKQKKVKQGHAVILRQDAGSLIVAFRLDPSKITDVLGTQPKKKRRRAPRRPTNETQHTHFAPPFSQSYATPFYSFHERENDDLKSKPYGGILSEADADTSKTLPQAGDRARFEEARQKAEDEWKQKTANLELEGEIKGRASHKLAGPPSKIKCINFGGFEIETWYAAPYPEEYSRNRVLYICEFCLKYMNSDYVAWRHKLKCPAKHPPGDEIYRDGSVSVFEVDGRKNPVYCQNLCLLAKLFLGSKTLYYDVEPFLFYVMTEYDELGCHFVGYFSKEKRPSSQNNVSCILTLPTQQRKGYGNLLIDFSYLLTRVERKTGSPEKPLSDMGLVSYRNYWRLVLSYQLRDQSKPLSIVDISERTGMTADDIVSALEGLRALVRDPVTKTYALRLDYDYFYQCIEGWEAKGYVKLNPDALVWTPYIMGRSNLAHYDRAPPLSTIAPREGEDEEKPAPEEGAFTKGFYSDN
ncbi:histone acetyltransferase [Lasallia pustulata]|uniref:Histone acetyltransferase n=1 Tax=Lasallia pustulata TaxID=136370 RepID=A0A1W5CZA0_9LECA|nr:histone acetyltransferase [Lasallia pustulata]